MVCQLNLPEKKICDGKSHFVPRYAGMELQIKKTDIVTILAK